MKITQHSKKDGSIVYRSSVYLGIDQVTGKQVTTKVTGRTKKEVKQKAQDAIIDFKVNGSTRFQASTISTYEELARLWWDNHKHTVKQIVRMLLEGS